MLATIHSSNRSSQIPYVILATKYTYCICICLPSKQKQVLASPFHLIFTQQISMHNNYIYRYPIYTYYSLNKRLSTLLILRQTLKATNAISDKGNKATNNITNKPHNYYYSRQKQTFFKTVSSFINSLHFSEYLSYIWVTIEEHTAWRLQIMDIPFTVYIMQQTPEAKNVIRRKTSSS